MTTPTNPDDVGEETARRLEEIHALRETPAVTAAVSAALTGDVHAADSLTGDEQVAALMALMEHLDEDELTTFRTALESRANSLTSADET